MPRRRPGAKVRLNLEVAESVHKRVLLLQELTNADSMTEVVRRALKCYEFVVRAEHEGERLLLQRGNETVTLVVL